MRHPCLRLLTALALLLQAAVGLSPAWATTGPGPPAMCHSGDRAAPIQAPTQAPIQAPTGLPAHHDCLACPVCAAATTPVMLVPPPPQLPPPVRLPDVMRPRTRAAAPSPSRPPANLPRGPPRLA